MDDPGRATSAVPDVGDVVRVVITGRYVLSGVPVYTLRVLRPSF